MEPINPRVRFRLSGLALALVAFAGGLVAAPWEGPTTVVVVTAPAAAAPVPVPVAICRGYAWRTSSIDLRPWCGY